VSSSDSSDDYVRNKKGLGGTSIMSRSSMKYNNRVIEIQGRSLNLFDEDNPFRMNLSTILTKSGIFENFIYLMIFLQAVTIALDEPIHSKDLLEKGGLLYYIDIINNIITYVFIVEMVIKIIVFGLFTNGPKSYLKSGWNILDCIIVLISILGMIIGSVLTE